MASATKSFADTLGAMGLMDAARARALDQEARRAHLTPATLALRQNLLSEHDALLALATHYGVPAVDLNRAIIPRATLALVPVHVAQQKKILPLRLEDATLMLALEDPLAKDVLDEVTFVTGKRVLPYVALPDALVTAAVKAYAVTTPFYGGAAATPGSGDQAGYLPVIMPAITSTPSAPPAAEADAPEIEVEVADEPLDSLGGGAAKIVLVVDDEPEIVRLITDIIKPMGHEVVTASRGGEALGLIKKRNPDLIVLDAMLPEVHGFEICRKVKQSRRFGKTPVLMVSAIYRGWRIAEDIKSLYGADAFLEKPFRLGEIRRHIERLIAKRAAEPDEENLRRDATTAYDAAVQAYQAKDFTSALECLREAEAIEPFAAKIQFMLGRVLEERQHVFQAIYHYERAVELAPKLFAAAKNLALLYQTAGFKNKAVEMWERALQAAPSSEVREQIKQHLVSIL